MTTIHKNVTRGLQTLVEKGYYRVSNAHRLYYEVHGNPTGPAAVVLHGPPPGSMTPPTLTSLFDLNFWKVVLFDARSCGRSLPAGLLYSHTTRHLVGDIEKLRYHLGIAKWLVLGGSYGSTLALCYAQEHTSRVIGMVLRSVMLMQQCEVDWLFTPTGIALEVPDAWSRFLSILRPNECGQPIRAYYNRMLSTEDGIRIQAARYWREWMMSVMFTKLPRIDRERQRIEKDDFLTKPVNMYGHINAYFNRTIDNVVEEIPPLPSPVLVSLMEAHYYFNNDQFMKTEFPILKRVNRIRELACTAIHAIDDRRSLKENAQQLKSRWPKLKLEIVNEGGHCQFHPVMRIATMKAMEDMKQLATDMSRAPRFHDETPQPTYRIPEPFYKKKYR